MKIKILVLSLFLICLVGTVRAKVVLPAYFTDNMILQQRATVSFNGLASAGKEIILKTGWDGQVYRTQADANGKWNVSVHTPSYGGPYVVTVSDGEELRLKNILIGEVWFCSGQSNMEMPVSGWGKVMNYEKEIAGATYPSIRLFQVKKRTSLVPSDSLEANMGGWMECSPATVPDFSAVAYFYARSLWKELHVPIGVIDCTWGGTPAEAWIGFDALRKVGGFGREVAQLQGTGFDKTKMMEAYRSDKEAWQNSFITKDKGYEGGVPRWAGVTCEKDGWKSMDLPGYWEGKGLADFDGVVWFRNEIELPADWKGKRVKLSLGKVDDEDVTFVNGTEIGRTSGYDVARKYEISPILTEGNKIYLTVRVSDFGSEGGIYGDAGELYAEYNGKRISLAGNWEYKVGLPLASLPPVPISPTESSSYPTVLYNAMVHPLIHFPIKGVIWYQGEANVGRAAQYTDLFYSLISDWRRQWQEDFPFYFVQLANFLQRQEVQPHSLWAALRESQSQALHLDKTGMVVTLDIGMGDNIHYKNKQEVGRRLGLLALSQTYGHHLDGFSPRFKSYEIEGANVKIGFDFAGKGLEVKGTSLHGFTIAGPDHVFHPAVAVLRDDIVTVSSPDVSTPVAVRYGWADNQECGLYGKNGLPVAPFRTDSW